MTYSFWDSTAIRSNWSLYCSMNTEYWSYIFLISLYSMISSENAFFSYCHIFYTSLSVGIISGIYSHENRITDVFFRNIWIFYRSILRRMSETYIKHLTDFSGVSIFSNRLSSFYIFYNSWIYSRGKHSLF